MPAGGTVASMITAGGDSGAWVRRFHDAPGSVRLVCLPFAGGSASYFRPLALSLAPDIEVLAVQLPGRQDRRLEPVLTDLHIIADRIFEALSPWGDMPLAVFGHSMGAAVGFELVRRFERQGLTAPALLVVSARSAPSLATGRAVHRLDEEGIFAEVAALGGTDPSVFTDPELRAMALPALRGDYQAVEEYRAPVEGAVVGVPVIALAGDADPRVAVGDVAAWGKHTDSAFRLEVFSGGHFYLSDHITEVAALLRSALLPG